MNILAIGAHADDVELGCGGSLLKWGHEGCKITIYIATDSAYSAPDGKIVRSCDEAEKEASESAEKIGAKLIIDSFKCFELDFSEPLNARLVALIKEEEPDLVLTHWHGDTHPDHQAIAKATLHSSKHTHSVLMYMSNWYLGTEPFDSRIFVDISETFDGKRELITIFGSENDRTDGDWMKYIRERSENMGRSCGVKYAEGFFAVKYLIKLPKGQLSTN